ncbi:MAG TPA: DUF6152 family protein [Gammaproteobacteria bacterium]|nr:DUF6152 family protein [Gammaproteobacteria bacterium]
MKTNNPIFTTLVTFCSLLPASGAVFAHHSFTAEFDAKQPVTLDGTVVKVEWTNPHVWVYINVMDEKTGDVSNWGIEMGAPSLLSRQGWRSDSLYIGQEVTVNGYRSRSGLPRVSARHVTLTATGKSPAKTLDAGSSIKQQDKKQ